MAKVERIIRAPAEGDWGKPLTEPELNEQRCFILSDDEDSSPLEGLQQTTEENKVGYGTHIGDEEWPMHGAKLFRPSSHDHKINPCS